jgi:hypothetical protein
LIQILDVEIKRTEPYRLLARIGGASGQESLCADYLACMLPVTFWGTWKHRNPLELMCHLAFTLSSVVLPLLGAIYFERFDTTKTTGYGNFTKDWGVLPLDPLLSS